MRMLLLSLFFSALFLPESAFALNISGSYKTTEGNITFKQNGDRVTGRYTQDNGEISGVLYDSTLDALWIEDHSDRRCSSPKNGRYYWGRISFEFTDDGFSGIWGYCNDSPSRPWTGSRIGGSVSSTPDSESIAVDTGSGSIAGIWSSSEGDINFKASGDRITGRYNPQDNGEISGRIRGTNLDAIWVENHSATRCSSPKNGRYYWGKLKLAFDGDRFTGKWGYCDEPATRPWNGQRK